MTTKQLKKITRNNNVYGFLNGAPLAIKQRIAHFEEVFGEFRRVKLLSDGSRVRQLKNIGKNSKNKAEKRERMMELALDVSAKVNTYAKRVGDMELYGSVNYKRRDLVLFSDGDCQAVCRVIYKKAVEVVDKLGPYGLDSDSLGEFLKAIEVYKVIAVVPLAEIKQRKDATRDLKAALREADGLLKSLDELVLMVRLDEPKFYAAYIVARKLRKPGFRKLSGQGQVLDADGNPLGLVTMRCEALGINRQLSVNGGFRLFHIKDGLYEFWFEKEGFVGVRLELRFIKRFRTEIEVVMLTGNSES